MSKCKVKGCAETKPHIHNIDLGWSIIETKSKSDNKPEAVKDIKEVEG